MRRYIVVLEDPPVAPWVLGDSADEGWLGGISTDGLRTIAISEAEAEADPDLREAVQVWKANDDSAHEQAWVIEDAEGELFDATLAAGLPYEQLLTPPRPRAHRPSSLRRSPPASTRQTSWPTSRRRTTIS